MRHKVTETHRHPKYPRLVVDLRSKSRFYQMCTFLDGRQRQKSTQSEKLSTALRLAEEWYLGLIRQQTARKTFRHPTRSIDPTMEEQFAVYQKQLPAKKKQYADWRWNPIRSFWGTRPVREISPKVFTEFYKWRRRRGDVSNHTIFKDVCLIRQILKNAAAQEILDSLPFVPRVGTINSNPRKWLNASEWDHLKNVSQTRITEANGNARLTTQRKDNHDFMTFLVHSMMRVDEARSLKFSDCRFTENKARQHVMVCDVRKSKTGPRTAVCSYGAARVVMRRKRGRGPNDLVFPGSTTRAFQSLLKAADLYEDDSGIRRNLKSLRATGISFRILDGDAPIALIAKNSGTSIQSISKFYAKYLRGEDDIDALTTVRPSRMGENLNSPTEEKDY